MGHLVLAQCALERFELATVLFMPCSIQPHKESAVLAPVEHRAAMIENAITDNLQFEMLDVEIRRGGTSYTIESVIEIRERYSNAEICFIIGSDTLPELHTWKDIYRLLEICTFVTLSRLGCDLSAMTASDLNLQPPWPARLLSNVATGRVIDISSSDIRHRVAEGMSIRYLVPQSVEMYISEHGLYR